MENRKKNTGKKHHTWKGILAFASGKKRLLAFSAGLSILGVTVGIVPYILIGWIAKEYMAGLLDTGRLLFLVGCSAAACVLQGVLQGGSTLLSHRCAFRILENIRISLTEKMNRLSMGTIRKVSSGEYKNLILDEVEKLEYPLAHAIPEMTGNLTAFLAVFILMLCMDVRLAFSALITLPVGFLIMKQMFCGYGERYAKFMKAGDNLNKVVVEYLNGIEVIKVFNQAGSTFEKMKQTVTYWTSAMVRKILDDERYTGKAIYGKTTRKKVGSSRVKAVTEDQWTVVDGAFPAIITQEIFNTAKSLNRNSHPGSAGESTRVFYRKIRCGHCGLAMERLQSAHPCYVCRTDRYKPDIGCPQDRIDEKELEQTVLAAIRMMAQLVRGAVQAKQRQSAKDTRYNQRLDRQIKAHQNSIQMRQQEKMAAFEDMVSGKVSAEDYQHKRGQCEKHIQRLETKIKELGDAKRRAKEEELSTYNIIPYTNVRTLTRELVDLLIQNIYIYSSTSIEIVWKCGDEYQRLLADTTKKEAAEREQG